MKLPMSRAMMAAHCASILFRDAVGDGVKGFSIIKHLSGQPATSTVSLFSLHVYWARAFEPMLRITIDGGCSAPLQSTGRAILYSNFLSDVRSERLSAHDQCETWSASATGGQVE